MMWQLYLKQMPILREGFGTTGSRNRLIISNTDINSSKRRVNFLSLIFLLKCKSKQNGKNCLHCICDGPIRNMGSEINDVRGRKKDTHECFPSLHASGSLAISAVVIFRIFSLNSSCASKAKVKCQVTKSIIHYNWSALFLVSLLQILLWRLLGSRYFYVAHVTLYLHAKFLHNHCFRYVIAVFSEKAKTMLMLLYCFPVVVGRGRGGGVGKEGGWAS